MKYLIVICIMMPSLTFAKDSCAAKIFEYLEIDENSQIGQCISESDSFKKATSTGNLCNSDSSKISDMFSTYLAYEESYKNKVSETLNSSEEDATLLREEARQINRDWIVFGHKVEVGLELNEIKIMKSRCTPDA